MGDLASWCKLGMSSQGQKGLMKCTVLLTEPQAGAVTLFPDAPNADFDELSNLGTSNIVQARVSAELLTQELSMMPNPCRIVVSGPEAYNSAVRNMCLSNGVDKDAITILEA